MGRRRQPISERVKRYAVSESGCWEWLGQKTKFGYGFFTTHVGLPSAWKRVPRTAHRASWEVHRGPIPEGMCVLHRCDNRGCINPDHLFLGTYRDNSRDAADKGRNFILRGEAHPRSKLTDEQVESVAWQVTSGVSMGEVARRFGVSRTLVRRIASGHRWRHVLGSMVTHDEAKCAQCRQRSRRGLRNPQGFVPAVPLPAAMPMR